MNKATVISVYPLEQAIADGEADTSFSHKQADIGKLRENSHVLRSFCELARSHCDDLEIPVCFTDCQGMWLSVKRAMNFNPFHSEGVQGQEDDHEQASRQ